MRGYSLVELLVALALFAVIAVLVYGGLDQLAGAGTQLQQASGRLSALQRAVDRIGDDLRQAVERPVRGGHGGSLPALVGGSDVIELTRGGHGNSLALPRAELERVGWRLAGDRLQRLRFHVLDRLPATDPREDVLLEQVERFELRYLDVRGGVHARWPVPESNQLLPRAVEVRMTVVDFGEIRRVFELPEGAQ
ncbi:MAG TPA: type II secretion system minor pseudopilin GspJ [Xanthomonadaceae bacterium]|nr:type II secretion system minor pseudopilin GspJ [Xanthomonadaceae bacterium]